ncbi:DoxX family protein [Deinococcus peraridilitoris]|uniref:Putative membrane protein n=1 Tax=Deinococcus peraridilitoris (strain DSM 19664 / LMG 22246 / CIP 109416 / KR-200) TaxID=937777 RepID=K9ZW40_DEIPD|nr:hypothetical protein [Deinococcus peraridilitoris]AFZ65781.1 putative membrane protein [Deinococcus peraridilitoris DSM 19664]
MDSRRPYPGPQDRPSLGHIALALAFGGAGLLHFVHPETFERIVPALVPARPAVVLSGAVEILGALGLLFSGTRRAAGWGLIALLVAVWPANIEMARRAAEFDTIPPWALWLRAVLQPALLWWVWRVVLRKPNERSV